MNTDKKYPHLENETRRLESICLDELKKTYADEIPIEIQHRVNNELKAIIDSEMCGVFLIFHELIIRSRLRRYELGYSGMIGASLVAYLCGITSVDPTRTEIPLYPECLFGVSFEKEPYIAIHVPEGKSEMLYSLLNESEGVKYVAHAFQEDGTPAELMRLLIPDNDNDEISDYGIHTTPFYKIRIIDSPYLLLLNRIIELTGVFPERVQFDDAQVLDMFKHTDDPELIDISPWHLTAIGLPEINNIYAARMYGSVDVNVESFADLVRISALTHGCGLWEENQEESVRKGTIEFQNIFCSREDVYEYCRNTLCMGKEPAFAIMESVRKGRGIPHDFIMESNKIIDYKGIPIPDWFASFCSKVRYLFPRVHSYWIVKLSWMLAWYRLHYPSAFYKAYMEIVSHPDICDAVLEGGHSKFDDLIKEKHDKRYKYLHDDDFERYDAERYRIDIAVADEMYFRGIDLTSPFLRETQCTAQFLIKTIKRALKKDIIAFRSEWSCGNLEIFQCDLFCTDPEMQDQLVMLIKEAWINGHRFTLHFNKNQRGCEELLERLKEMINLGQVIIKTKKRVFLYGLDLDETRLLQSFFRDTAELVDVTPQYQDILALNADVVIINIENASDEVLKAVTSFEEEAEDESVKYFYLTDEEIHDFFEKENKGLI